MTSEATNRDLLKQILSAKATAVLLHGPAGAGKTTVVLDFYEHFQQSEGGGCMIIAPNFPTVSYLTRLLLARSPCGVVVSPTVITFAGLAGRILADCGASAATMSAFARNLLLRRIVKALRSAGKLPALAAVAEAPGLPAALDKAIAELKRSAIEPEAIAAVVGESRGKTFDLLEVYRAYQENLLRAGAYDTEGLMWLARNRLADAPTDRPPPGLRGITAVAVDGFTDFTPTQLDILKSLTTRLKKVVITLPSQTDNRLRLWHWTTRTADRIRKTLGSSLAEITLSRPAEGDRSSLTLAELWDKVFDFEAAPAKLPEGLHVIAACGIDGEVSAVARRIKRLLLEGTHPEHIAVLGRTMEDYRPAVEKIFAACDIPLSRAPVSLATIPIVRFILDVAAMAPPLDSARGGEPVQPSQPLRRSRLEPQFRYRQVLRVIKNSYFRPQALGSFDDATVAAAETIILAGNVVAGRAAYAAAAERLARRAGNAGEEIDDNSPRCRLPPSELILKANEMLQALFDLSRQAGESIDGLKKIIKGLNLRAAAMESSQAETIARDLRALAELESVLAKLGDPPPTLAEFASALGEVRCRMEGGQSAVDVLDVLDARAIRYRHVFCLGVDEGLFPRRCAEGAFISEADRAAWAKRGLALDSRGDLTAREMLLFYLAVSRATESLTISYTEFDSAGKAGAASNFLHSLLHPLGGLDALERAGRLERIAPGEFLPPAGQIACRRDAVIAALAGLFEPTPPKQSPTLQSYGDGSPRLRRLDQRHDPDGSALAWAAKNAGDVIGCVASGIYARHCRWSARPPDAFDGRIDKQNLLAHLAERFGNQAIFSASQINSFGQCPWQFFARYVLSLQEMPSVEERLSPLDRGLFCHRVLLDVMTQLRGRDGGSVRLADVDDDALTDALNRAVDAQSRRIEQEGVAYPALWRIQREQLRRQLLQYLLAQRENAPKLKLESLHFELAFGSGEAQTKFADPASIAQPVAVETPAGAVCFQGRIDRVDRFTFGDLDGLLVVDYKTGALPKPADILAGRNVQLPLYSAAAEAILKQKAHGGAFHVVAGKETAETYFAAIKKRGGEFSINDKYEDSFAAAIGRIGQIVKEIRTGRFDVLPTDKCPRYCPFRRICHFAEYRAGLKSAGQEARP